MTIVQKILNYGLNLSRPVSVLVSISIVLLVLASLTSHTQAVGGCTGMTFCDTFDAAHPVTNRSGQLDGNIWGASRFVGYQNLSGRYNLIANTTMVGCSGGTVAPPNDIQVCGGQLRDSVNDNGDVAVLAMYPKQPFDFAGRTGRVVFDVSNDTQGNHAAWPEFWVTDRPVPAPFTHEASWISVPQNGFGVRFAAANSPGCPGQWTVDSAVISRNYVADDSFNGGSIQVLTAQNSPGFGCVTLSNGTTMNHVEVDVSQNQIDVYATNAGTTSPLVHLATIPNAGLTLTRGLVWIEDAHYNGNKFGSQGTHTFVWDNVGFDGPFTYRDASYDVLDANSDNGDGTHNEGWATPLTVTTVPMDGSLIPVAVSARLMFNFYSYNAPLTFTYVINGHPNTGAWPYPDTQTFSPKTISFDVPKSELLPGPNTISLTANAGVIVANINLVLVDVTDGGSPTPTPVPPTATVVPPSITPAPPTSTVVPPSQTPTSIPATATPTPTSTPVADVCNEAYFKNGVLTMGPVRTCP